MQSWVVAISLIGCASPDPPKLTKEQLGAALFTDPRLSEPAGQACADCHDAKLAFIDPEGDRVSPGVLRDRVGSRNSPTLMYAAFIPPLRRDDRGHVTGGLFWDGRASTLEEQVAGPLLNPLEMNNASKATVVAKLRSYYARQFRDAFGPDALADVDRAFVHLGEAIAAFERTPALSPFSSKYDRYLAGTAELADNEMRGLEIFEDPARGNCASCHPSRPSATGAPPLFTSFGYDNLGIPRFADSPFYSLPAQLNPDGQHFIDRGLATTTGDPADDGKFRVPTLRNIAITSPYTHNGYVRRLDEMVELLTGSCTRAGGCALPPAEVATNANRVRSSRPLSRQEILDLTAFLRTLSDE